MQVFRIARILGLVVFAVPLIAEKLVWNETAQWMYWDGCSQEKFVMEYVTGAPITEYCDRHNRLLLAMTSCLELSFVASGERGKDLSKKRCSSCHALDRDKEGPRLRGIFGRTSEGR